MAQLGQASGNENLIKEKLRLVDSKARVTSVIDGQTLIINNTKTLHLPAIYIPWEFNDNQGKYGKAAKDFLEKELLNKFIRIYQVRDPLRGQENSFGHMEAYIVTENGDLIQEKMIEQGFAFAYPTQNHFDVTDILKSTENIARDNKVGLWSEDKWQIKNTENIKGIENQFVIVEGLVNKVAAKNNIIYLNFGDNWKDDFSVAIESSLRKDFSKANMTVMQLSGKKIRVRGWVRDYNGPYMDIFHPSQIDILSSEIDNGL